MKYTILLTTLLLTSCTTMEYDHIYSTMYITPKMSPEGVKTLHIMANTKLPSYIKDTDLLDFHKRLISIEMGKQDYCPNGYDIDYDNAQKMEPLVQYLGECR